MIGSNLLHQARLNNYSKAPGNADKFKKRNFTISTERSPMVLAQSILWQLTDSEYINGKLTKVDERLDQSLHETRTSR